MLVTIKIIVLLCVEDAANDPDYGHSPDPQGSTTTIVPTCKAQKGCTDPMCMNGQCHGLRREDEALH